MNFMTKNWVDIKLLLHSHVEFSLLVGFFVNFLGFNWVVQVQCL